MATVVSQHICHLDRHLEFSKNLFCGKLQQMSLKLIENIYLQPQIGI